jgi:transposase
MARHRPLLTDEQWEKIAPLLPALPRSERGGRPWADHRRVLEGILWVLKTGARWRDLPAEYPSPSTCWRRLRHWEEEDVWLSVWRAFLAELDDQGQLDWEETFADATFVPAKKGAPPSGKLRGGRAQSFWWWSTARVFLWEATLPRRRPRKSRSSKRR